MNERLIGRVTSVEGFRVVIRLDDGLKGHHKSGYEDIYEVGRVNSYIILPVGPDRVVAVVTAVKTVDETQLAKDRTAIYLTEAVRYLTATMVGTISNGKYKLGVTVYPTIDGLVWYVTKAELSYIFDEKDEGPIDFSNDYYLPIGESPSFPDFKVKINPDKFFGKHAAILGNTGSGKSCTVASILQSLFEHDYNGENLKHAHIIIFDTNGEYRQAFFGDKAKGVDPPKTLEVINPFYIDKDGLKVPYWFMNYDDFDYLFEPSGGAQGPVLKRAIGMAKSDYSSFLAPGLNEYTQKAIIELLNKYPEEIKKKKNLNNYGNPVYNPENDILAIASSIPDTEPEGVLARIKNCLQNLGEENSFEEEQIAITALKSHYKELLLIESAQEVTRDSNIDLPNWFSFIQLISQFLDDAVSEQENNGNRIKDYISTLRLRLESYLNDYRISNLMLLDSTEAIPDALSRFLAYILGDSKYVKNYDPHDFISATLNKNTHPSDSSDSTPNRTNQVTIIDMSLARSELLETMTGLIGRMILEFLTYFPNEWRGNLPTVLVLEEAQNYIPEKDKKERISISKKVFERIAREGRKYGLSLVLSSQRPSELSKTVLSQCNSFVIHRLQNPEDQKYIRQLVSSANEDILQQLPILPQQHAIIMGDAVRSPVQAKIRDASPVPNSHDPKFVENWLEEYPEGFPPYKEIADAWEKGKKYESVPIEIIPDPETPISDIDTSVEWDIPF